MYEALNQTALNKLLCTGTCRAKLRPALPYCHVRSALFWDIMQRRLLIPYLHFRTTYVYQPHLQGLRNPKREQHNWS